MAYFVRIKRIILAAAGSVSLCIASACFAQERASPGNASIDGSAADAPLPSNAPALLEAIAGMDKKWSSPDRPRLVAACNAMVALKEEFHRLKLEQQLQFLFVELGVPLYWCNHDGDAAQREQHALKHIDVVVGISGELKHARDLLPLTCPSLEFYSVFPVTNEVRLKREEMGRNFEIADQIRRVEELKVQYASEAPSVLAGFLLFVNDTESVLKRMEKEPGITPEIVEATRKLLKERQERRKKSPVGK